MQGGVTHADAKPYMNVPASPCVGVSAHWMADERVSNEVKAKRFRHLLREYMEEYPAFRAKPVGAPHSEARCEQQRRIQLEDEARALLDVIS
jgi:hypothetical protein